jgi:acetyl-CoA carboxylase carboxyltransferase component
MELSEKEKQKILKEIEESYAKASSPYYAAARLWIDEIIDPLLTREYVSLALEAANNNPDIPRFNPGVIQT